MSYTGMIAKASLLMDTQWTSRTIQRMPPQPISVISLIHRLCNVCVRQSPFSCRNKTRIVSQTTESLWLAWLPALCTVPWSLHPLSPCRCSPMVLCNKRWLYWIFGFGVWSWQDPLGCRASFPRSQRRPHRIRSAWECNRLLTTRRAIFDRTRRNRRPLHWWTDLWPEGDRSPYRTLWATKVICHGAYPFVFVSVLKHTHQWSMSTGLCCLDPHLYQTIPMWCL